MATPAASEWQIGNFGNNIKVVKLENNTLVTQLNLGDTTKTKQ
jgi:hypothetical protein